MKWELNKKTGILIIVLIIFISGCTQTNNPNTNSKQETTTTINYENLRIMKMELPGMFCGGCVAGVTNILKGVDGVIKTNITLQPKQGEVIYDSTKTTAEEIVEQVKYYNPKLLSDEKYKGDIQI